jgi:hypothetical protein
VAQLGVCGSAVVDSKRRWTVTDEPGPGDEEDRGLKPCEATQEPAVSAVDAWLDTEIFDPSFCPAKFCPAPVTHGTPKLILNK